MAAKVCRKCGETKDTSEFYASKSNADGLHGSCKVCFNARNKNKYKTDPSYRSAKLEGSRQRYLLDPIKYRSRARELRLKNYGITQDQFDALVREQDGRCALCGSQDHKSPNPTGTWSVDHDHDTGTVRGLLCNDCNVSLGHFEKLTRQVSQDRVHQYLLKGICHGRSR